MDDRPLLTVGHGPNGCIQHRIDQAASGCVPIDQLMTMPSKQSMMGEMYTLPAGIGSNEDPTAARDDIIDIAKALGRPGR